MKQFPCLAVMHEWGRANAELIMCEKCVEMDRTIERCERAVIFVGDRVTVERLTAMVKDLRAQKAALHAEQPKSSSYKVNGPF
jgi:hypothetical protein